MCWHELNYCCCCLPLRQGLGIIGLAHALGLSLVLAFSLATADDDDDGGGGWMGAVTMQFLEDRHHEVQVNTIVSVCSLGILFNLILLLGVVLNARYLFLPWFAFQTLLILVYFAIFLKVALDNWEDSLNFYTSLLALSASFLLLYSWIIAHCYYKVLRARQKVLADDEAQQQPGPQLNGPNGPHLELNGGPNGHAAYDFENRYNALEPGGAGYNY